MEGRAQWGFWQDCHVVSFCFTKLSLAASYGGEFGRCPRRGRDPLEEAGAVVQAGGNGGSDQVAAGEVQRARWGRSCRAR